MDIGIGLPNTLPGASGQLILQWAERAEERGFATLASVDRIVYSNVDPLITLAAAAAVTRRIGLFTDILLATVRLPALLAKEAASLDVVAGGRLTLGLAPGGRPEDFAAVGLSFTDRGRRFDQGLKAMQSIWRGEQPAGLGRPIGPAPPRGDIPVLIGGTSPQAIRRAATVGVGYTAGSAASGSLEELVGAVRAAWQAAGRAGEPRLSALNYYALGEGVDEAARANLADYYGVERGGQIAARLPRDAPGLRAHVKRLQDAGVTEAVLLPAVRDLAQVDRLADALL